MNRQKDDVVAPYPVAECGDMFSLFIREIEWLTFAMPGSGRAYPGYCARCHFDLSAYREALFAPAEIVMPVEVQRSVPKRQAEYLAGRYLAKRVLSRLNISGYVLASGVDRAPVWPTGIAGSISHNVDHVLCAVHRCDEQICGVGLDIESWMSDARADSLWPGIADDMEYDWLHRHAPVKFAQMLTLSFSAKESLFKALYPQVKCYFDFLDARMTALDTAQQTFTLQLLTSLSPEFPAGRCFSGRYLWRERDITTFLFL